MNHDLLIICVVSIVTFITRVIPFILFKDRKYPLLDYLGDVLPFCVMAMLVVYCLKDFSFISYPFGLPEIIAVLCVIGLHIFKRNTLLSIIGGTMIYMFCVQLIFV